ncbi:MAG: Transcriptional regulator, MarR family, partial [uncultured Rubrobacteraceae bacterium]
ERREGRGDPSDKEDYRFCAGEGLQGAQGKRRGDAGGGRAARRAGYGPDRALAERRPARRGARVQARRGTSHRDEDAPAPGRQRPRRAAPRPGRRPQLPGVPDGWRTRPGRPGVGALGAGRGADVRGARPIRAPRARQVADEGTGRARHASQL